MSRKSTSRFSPHFITLEFDNISVNPVRDLTLNKPGLLPPLKKSVRFNFSFRDIIKSKLNMKEYGVHFVKDPRIGFTRELYRQVLFLAIEGISYKKRRNVKSGNVVRVTCSGRLMDSVESRTIWQGHEVITRRIEGQGTLRVFEEKVSSDCVGSLLGLLPSRWRLLS